jgi:Ran GTPase-activating protein (RanGAP) involved in mRNA processing and transport
MTVSLTLELTSRGGGSDVGTVKKTELSDDGVRITVTLPRLIDGEQANLTAALLLEQMDLLAGGFHVERVKLSGLSFTAEGVAGLQGFLSVHAAHIKSVSIKEMLVDDSGQEDKKAFSLLAKVFRQSKKLEILNLSDNTLEADVWEDWAMHTGLRQLILDYVELDDDSLISLSNNFTFGESLEELYVVLTKNIGLKGLEAANNILEECKKVSSLRWVVKDAPPDALMPWAGLAIMAREMNLTKTGALHHLVMDGGTIDEDELSFLRGALRNLPLLRTAKLRSIGLNDTNICEVVKALETSKPPLETLDLSRNLLQSAGAAAVAELASVEKITNSLQLLGLDLNQIDASGARTLLETFGSKASHKMELKMDGNPFSYSKVAFNVARRKGQAELEREKLMEEVDRLRTDLIKKSTGTKQNDTLSLQEQVEQLQEEKALLMKAFAVMGTADGVEQQTTLMDRVALLEKRVFGSTQDDGSRRGRVSPQSSGSSLTMPSTSRGVSRSSSLEELPPQPLPESEVSSPTKLSTKLSLSSPHFIKQRLPPVQAPGTPGENTATPRRTNPNTPRDETLSPRRTNRELVSAIRQTPMNLLVRGTSERCISPVEKRKKPSQLQLLQGTPTKTRSKMLEASTSSLSVTSSSSAERMDRSLGGSYRELRLNERYGGSFSSSRDSGGSRTSKTDLRRQQSNASVLSISEV